MFAIKWKPSLTFRLALHRKSVIFQPTVFQHVQTRSLSVSRYSELKKKKKLQGCNKSNFNYSDSLHCQLYFLLLSYEDRTIHEDLSHMISASGSPMNGLLSWDISEQKYYYFCEEQCLGTNLCSKDTINIDLSQLTLCHTGIKKYLGQWVGYSENYHEACFLEPAYTHDRLPHLPKMSYLMLFYGRARFSSLQSEKTGLSKLDNS